MSTTAFLGIVFLCTVYFVGVGVIARMLTQMIEREQEEVTVLTSLHYAVCTIGWPVVALSALLFKSK